ncbi:hypothetical protein, partial [Herbaspirillum rubrisubalbicans]|uniref:hypothetical protein n=1 Tax=Herbaspirillum rubrisubalbicans TaxID=80842 RepID=UPI0004751ED9
ELLTARGDHAALLKPLATTHANTHKIGLNMDAAGQSAFRRVMEAVIGDIDTYYKEIGFAG